MKDNPSRTNMLYLFYWSGCICHRHVRSQIRLKQCIFYGLYTSCVYE